MVGVRARELLAAVACAAALVGCSDDDSGGTSSEGDGGAGAGQTSSSASSGEGGASSGSGGSSSTASGTGAGGAAPSEITGYWVWSKQIENGQVLLEITDADMEGKVGSSGWSGCPDGILCTHYGIHKVAFGATGKLHYQQNVFTSSDFQTLGTWAAGDAGHGTFERQQQFSCAHPESVNADVVPGGFRHQMVGGELQIGVADFGSSFPLYDDGTEPTRFIAYKPVSRDDYYGKYMIRVCQPHDGFMCHEGCVDNSLVDEP
jgi:hypothetical protein